MPNENYTLDEQQLGLPKAMTDKVNEVGRAWMDMDKKSMNKKEKKAAIQVVFEELKKEIPSLIAISGYPFTIYYNETIEGPEYQNRISHRGKDVLESGENEELIRYYKLELKMPAFEWGEIFEELVTPGAHSGRLPAFDGMAINFMLYHMFGMGIL